jgi:hypothetical protein
MANTLTANESTELTSNNTAIVLKPTDALNALYERNELFSTVVSKTGKTKSLTSLDVITYFAFDLSAVIKPIAVTVVNLELKHKLLIKTVALSGESIDTRILHEDTEELEYIRFTYDTVTDTYKVARYLDDSFSDGDTVDTVYGHKVYNKIPSKVLAAAHKLPLFRMFKEGLVSKTIFIAVCVYFIRNEIKKSAKDGAKPMVFDTSFIAHIGSLMYYQLSTDPESELIPFDKYFTQFFKINLPLLSQYAQSDTKKLPSNLDF